MSEKRSEYKALSVKLSVREVAVLLNETERAVWMRVYRRQIPHRRWGKKVIILRDELDKFLRELNGTSVEEALNRVEVAE